MYACQPASQPASQLAHRGPPERWRTMLPWPFAVVFSVTLTFLAAAVLLSIQYGHEKPSVPLWCLYDIDDPFDLGRSGRFCDIIVLCCLVDERGPDAISSLRNGLLRSGLSLPLLVMPWRDDWFWRRLCDDMVTKEFVNLFVESLTQLEIAGVVHSDTTECLDDALLLNDRLLDLVKRSKPLRVEIRSPHELMMIGRTIPQRFASCRTTHVLLWDMSIIEPQVCRLGVTWNVSKAAKLRKELPSVTVVHAISVSFAQVSS